MKRQGTIQAVALDKQEQHNQDRTNRTPLLNLHRQAHHHQEEPRHDTAKAHPPKPTHPCFNQHQVADPHRHHSWESEFRQPEQPPMCQDRNSFKPESAQSCKTHKQRPPTFSNS